MIRAGANARSAANIGAAGTLLSGAGQLGMAYGSYNKPSGDWGGDYSGISGDPFA